MNKKIIFDIETDGINATKIHVLSYAFFEDGEWRINSVTSYDEMSEIMSRSETTYIGHNIVQFDVPAILKILEVNLHETSDMIDTLPLSWYLYPNRKKHGLDSWGMDLGIKKPNVLDWENLPLEVYIERCEADVSINLNLWNIFYYNLFDIYQEDEGLYKLAEYLTFKMQCANLQEQSKWRLDVEQCKKNLEILTAEKMAKTEQLKAVMPQTPIIKVINKPESMYTASGKLSKVGSEWNVLMFERGFPDVDKVEINMGTKISNPSSVKQVKDWLFSLGWVPMTYKDTVNKKTGARNSVPQISTPDKELCESVKKLIEVEPNISVLEGLTVISSRIGILKGFLRDQVDGFLSPRIAGLTNTLRFKHAEIVNLPKVGVMYGEYIRSCLIAREGMELLGADMTSLEDKTKLHYLQPLDPQYVKAMQVEGYDPHLDLAVIAEALTWDQMEAHKSKKENHKKVRDIYKTANYLITYGGGAEKLAKSAGITVHQAKKIRAAYWKRNWAILQVSKQWLRKTTSTGNWVLNPVSGNWHQLRAEKDVFSTVNSSTGVWCFDYWIRTILSKRRQLTAQFHDEIILEVKKGYQDQARDLVEWAIKVVNDEIKLNIPLGISVQFGEKYSDIH